MPLAQVALLIGTLIIAVPARDGLIIVADSTVTRRTAGSSARSVEEKVFTIPNLPGTAFAVTGITPVEWIVGDATGTVLDARGLLRARLSYRGSVSEQDFFAVADEARRIAARIHRMGPEAASQLVERDLFTALIFKKTASGYEIGSFIVRLTASSAEVTERKWERFQMNSDARVLMFGEGAFVGRGLASWQGGAAECARAFLGAGRRTVAQTDAATAARGAYSIQEAASIAIGDTGTIGPPFRAYLLSNELQELPPVAPCR